MSTSTTAPPSPSDFQSAFERVFGLILEEWPSVTIDALKETSGDLDRVTALVAEASGKTKALVKRQLGELMQLVDEGAPAARPFTAQTEKLTDFIELLEGRTRELLELAKGEFPEARAKIEASVEEHPWTSLLIALGLGFIVGLIMRGGRR
jgi:ElaB/YqjD/DUF883 family membrane-anchored ribosome-binding protein